jgi:hypothetical protein
MFVTLRCGKCGNMNCDICPIGTYIPEGSKRGCTREVTEDINATYEYLMEEIKYSDSSTTKYKDYLNTELESLYQNIYSCPISRKLDKNGKIVE